MMTLPQYLEMKNLTQAEFARSIGVTQGTVSKLCREEADRRPLSIQLAAKIAATTGGAVPMSVWIETPAPQSAHSE